MAKDARAKRLLLECPGCKRTRRNIDAGYVATTVRTFSCRRCDTRWHVVIRPLRASAAAVIRQVEWLPLGPAEVR